MSRNDQKTLNRAATLFDSASEMGSGSFRRRLIQTITDQEFIGALFKPIVTKDYGKEEAAAKITQVYDVASRRKTIHAIAEALNDYGYGGMTRTTAVFLVTLVNLGMATIDAKATEIGRQKDHSEINGREFDRQMERLDDYQDDLRDILKVAKKIVKSKARDLSENTGLPRELCASALFTVPGPEFLDQYKIGFYLKTLLGNLYGFVDMDPDAFETDFDDVNWKLFFGVVFGKTRLPDVASLILLEGAESIDRYKNRHDVKNCWDSLTTFALKTLDRAPESIRDQMIELYLKRLNRMLANHSIDLRIDLRDIDNFRFENLVETVDKYRSKIDKIMDLFRGSSKNNRPMVASD